jgi:hypothetical protein
VKRIFSAINAVIAISFGIVVLLGYFIPLINPFRFILLQWAVILAGVAVIIGVWNLFSVHMQKISARRTGWVNSVILILFMFITAIVGLIPLLIGSLFPGVEPTTKPVVDFLQKLLLDGIMIPAEISLMAVLAVTLLYASVRLLRVRPDWASILFLVTTLIILLGLGPLPYMGQIPLFSVWIRPFVSDAFAAGGARGILIGVALGTLTTGLRILFGADRPYGDS